MVHICNKLQDCSDPCRKTDDKNNLFWFSLNFIFNLVILVTLVFQMFVVSTQLDFSVNTQKLKSNDMLTE